MADASGKVAIVTGGTRGLGAAISTRLMADGVTVAAVYRSDEATARQFAEAAATPEQLSTYRRDVSDPDECVGLVSEVHRRFGRLDYLINNAGSLTEHKLTDLTPRVWNDSLQVNLSAAFHLSQAAVAPMRKAKFGRIVNVGSVTAVMGSPFQIDYAAAKGGLVGLTRSMARAVARAGITVNCLLPGGFDTHLLGALTLTDPELIAQSVPVGRFGHPRELAHMVAALLHEDAAYVTGSVVVIDGGLSMGQ
jgi:NAD(P)-dependent dehydrogenase (short-subunit alcohol dehydrogenase family)